VQGFSNFFIPNLATVHLQARGHSPPLTATRPCGRLRVAAPSARSLRSLPAPRVGWRRPVRLPPQRRSTPAAAPPPACAGPCGRTPLRRSIPASEATAAAPHVAHRSLRGHAHRSLRGRAAGPPCRPPSLSQHASCSRRGSRLALASISAPDADSAAPQPPLPPVRAPPIRNGLALAARALRALAARARGTEKLDRWGWVVWRGGPDWFGLAGWVG